MTLVAVTAVNGNQRYRPAKWWIQDAGDAEEPAAANLPDRGGRLGHGEPPLVAVTTPPGEGAQGQDREGEGRGLQGWRAEAHLRGQDPRLVERGFAPLWPIRLLKL